MLLRTRVSLSKKAPKTILAPLSWCGIRYWHIQVGMVQDCSATLKIIHLCLKYYFPTIWELDLWLLCCPSHHVKGNKFIGPLSLSYCYS